MGLFDLQSIEWTPAAYFLAFHAVTMVGTSVTIILGFTDGFYKWEPHTKEISSRPFELLTGGCLLGWSLTLVCALLHGASQLMCIVELIPMLAATYYHYCGKGSRSVIVNIVVMICLAYFGLMPLPEVKPIVWAPPAIYMAVIGSLVAFCGISLLANKADQLYGSEPHTKQIMSRQGELFSGSGLLGWGLGIWVGVIAGGAQDMNILYVIGIQPCSYYHYTQGGTKNVITNTVFSMIALYFGFAY